MNKKEIAEIKKQFTPDRCSITRICGCYVDGEKNKKTFPQAEPPVSFSARAYPFLQLLKAANKKKKDIYWGI